MFYRLKLRVIRSLQSQKRINTLRVTVVAFLLIIAVGTALLMLPAASKSGESAGLLTSLFTATSATCVTGLIRVDSYSQWSAFGQVVLLLLIQIGGLGFMSIITIFLFLMRRRMGLRQRMVLVQAMSLNSFDGVVPLMRRILLATFGIELTGALMLTVCFIPDFPLTEALWRGLFHSVSAFCNAGFDLMGYYEPFSSMTGFAQHPGVMLILSTLIIIGGLGFFVWNDIAESRSFRRMSAYTRLVLVTTAILLLSGTVLTLVIEWNNPTTLGPLSIPSKVLCAFFQSVTLRTAGFNSIDQATLHDTSKLLCVLFMLIGGSSGSTAGGIKTVTVALLVLSAVNTFHGSPRTVVFRRKIPHDQILSASAITLMVIMLILFGGCFLSISNGLPLIDTLYEAASAIGTVGMTTGITTALNVPSCILIMIYMFFGRVGIITISLAFLMGRRAQSRIDYPESQMLIG